MATATPTYDVFVSHSLRDQEFAADIAQRLSAEGLEPFYDASILPGSEISKVIWEALAECHAFIVVVSPETTLDAMGMVELGAATAWNKPIFVIWNGPASARLPIPLQNFQAFPRNRLDEVLTHIRQTLKPLTEHDRELLVNTYLQCQVPTDQLSQTPLLLQSFVKEFNSKSNRQISGSQVISELLRLRKNAKLPRIAQQHRFHRK